MMCLEVVRWTILLGFSLYKAVQHFMTGSYSLAAVLFLTNHVGLEQEIKCATVQCFMKYYESESIHRFYYTDRHQLLKYPHAPELSLRQNRDEC